ncbi:hypothetical protein AB1L30_11625 [Bremerella sp. JC817]|uniref:hypothetical protein n=1 Tax=Bremerella sp. JC817 TaxID=3231756 RepID=UPI003459C27A
MNETIEDYEFLFKDGSGRYALVQSGPDESLEVSTCLVYDNVMNMVLLIEDDELNNQVVTRLHESGVPILPNAP